MTAATWLGAVGASYCLLLAYISYRQQAVPHISEKVLALILLIEGLKLVSLAAISVDLYGLAAYAPLLRLATGPLLLIYTLLVLERETMLPGGTRLHFVPLGLMVALSFLNRNTPWLDIAHAHMVWFAGIAMGLSYLGYGLASLGEVVVGRRRLQESGAAAEAAGMSWLLLISGWVAAWGAILMVRVLYTASVVPDEFALEQAIIFSTVGTIIFCHFVALKGIQQNRMLEDKVAALSVVEILRSRNHRRRNHRRRNHRRRNHRRNTCRHPCPRPTRRTTTSSCRS